MIDISVYTLALYDLLVADATLYGQTTIDRGTRINFDPGRCPWVGIYPGDVATAPKLIAARTWSSTFDLQVVIQTASLSDDGTAASDLLGALIKQVLDIIDADLTLGVSGARVIGISWEYKYVVFDSDGSGDLFMPQAILKIKMEVRS